MHPAVILGANVSTVDSITFAVAALASLVGAMGVVVSRHPVHSALMLIMTLFGIAVLFVAQDAQFLAAVQVIVYAGAIVVLFLFVIMLLGVDRRESLAVDPLRGQRPLAVLLGLLSLAGILVLGRIQWATGARSVSGTTHSNGSNVATIAKSVFTTYLLPFEITGVLLVIAVIGAVVLARRMPPEDQRRLASPGEEDDGSPGAEPASAETPAETAVTGAAPTESAEAAPTDAGPGQHGIGVQR